MSFPAEQLTSRQTCATLIARRGGPSTGLPAPHCRFFIVMKHFAQALELKDDPVLIAEYLKYHERVWPEVRRQRATSGDVDTHSLNVVASVRCILTPATAHGRTLRQSGTWRRKQARTSSPAHYSQALKEWSVNERSVLEIFHSSTRRLTDQPTLRLSILSLLAASCPPCFLPVSLFHGRPG